MSCNLKKWNMLLASCTIYNTIKYIPTFHEDRLQKNKYAFIKIKIDNYQVGGILIWETELQ